MKEKLKEWAKKRGMNRDPKMSGKYHFVTLYPSHIEEFWKILEEDRRIEDEFINFVKELVIDE